ncbi:class I SAM-dependent methyltransferase [Paenibacillus wenxiniae]|uniref:Class I SAM-dependent methyltransferase n=1 Tax=Paenibacillus wenxiniae TaxID=1636843 RepID=A0ABW4RIW6_9BACL
MKRGNNDMDIETFEVLRDESLNAELLEEISQLSIESFGFFTKHSPRAYEYVWLADLVKKENPATSVLDIGAGVAPLPIYLSNQGIEVTTVDYSSFLRNYNDSDKTDWNEWGYLDYSEVDSGIQSYNQSINEIEFTSESFDYIYSISVIEHMPATERQKMWPSLFKWMKPNGQLLLTIDLYRGNNDLWNYNYGKVVESVDEHGTLESILQELSTYFLLSEVKVIRNMKYVDHIDIATISLTVKK